MLNNVIIYQVRVRAESGFNEFEAYFLSDPDVADVISALEMEAAAHRATDEESEDFIDQEVNEDRAQALETLIEIVRLVKTIQGDMSIRVAGTQVGTIVVERIPAYSRDPNRTIQELVA